VDLLTVLSEIWAIESHQDDGGTLVASGASYSWRLGSGNVAREPLAFLAARTGTAADGARPITKKKIKANSATSADPQQSQHELQVAGRSRTVVPIGVSVTRSPGLSPADGRRLRGRHGGRD